eukprot:GHVO01046393.1.p1 GENE.GHVO01046393.1~~GHVO01046393.1.p1  ORF type:complete len:137 (-),score=0.81 GHVO01046393.1:82-492(-)
MHDLLWTNKRHMVDSVALETSLGKSDHLMLTYRYVCYTHPPTRSRPVFCYSKANYDRMRDSMNIDWPTVLCSSTTQQSWDTFSNKLKDTCSQNIPASSPAAHTARNLTGCQKQKRSISTRSTLPGPPIYHTHPNSR